MVYINYKKINLNVSDLIVHPLGDLHVGHKNCDIDFIKFTLNNIPKEDNHRIILMGDLLDAGVKNAIGGSVYEQDMNIQEQIDTVCNLLKDYSNQIDGLVIGNHEFRVFKETGIDVCSFVSDKLNVPYDKYSGLITYSFNKKAYNIYYTHGSCGGGIENNLKKCKELSNKVVCDAYLMGHVHKNAYTKREVVTVDSRNEKINKTLQHFILTGHSLNYDNSYAEQANLEISPVGFPIVGLSGKNKSITVLT